VHFRHHAPEKLDYAITRYVFEARRHYQVLDSHLAVNEWMVGGAYGIVDMDVWGWARMIPFILGDDAWAAFPNLKRMVDAVSARPAAAKAVALKDRHQWKTEMDDEARRNMFRHMAA
jgi:GST-like protein